MRTKISMKREDNHEYEEFRRRYHKVGYRSAVHKSYNVRYVTYDSSIHKGNGLMCGKTMNCPQ